jgi:hypothetical protein
MWSLKLLSLPMSKNRGLRFLIAVRERSPGDLGDPPDEKTTKDDDD